MAVKGVLIVLCLCAMLGSILGAKVIPKPVNDEDTYGDLTDPEVQNDDYEEYGVEVPPGETNEATTSDEHAEFISKAEVFVANIGDTIKLPCETNNPDIINIWEKDEVFLFQGHVEVHKVPNIEEYSNSTLQVHVTNREDYGNYACILVTTNDVKSRPKIIHKIVPPSPAVIQKIVIEDNKTEFEVGETAKLTCVASGYPKPMISWHKGNERLQVEGETLIIPNLTEDNEGIYRCLADNHIQSPSHSHISIHVNHKPRISIGEYITSHDDNKAELICTVDSYPSPHVDWKKGNDKIKNEGKYHISTKRKEHLIESILVISNLSNEDFDVYTCVAKNKLGRTEKPVTLVKVPIVREFVKPVKNNKDVVLTWKIESKLPITAHEIQYRKRDGEWKIAKPEVTDSNSDVYTVKYTLKDLEPGTYDARVRSMNEHGWSQFSDIVPFEGVLAKQGSSTHKNHHKKQHKEKELREKHFSPIEATTAPQQQEIVQKEAPVGASTPDNASQKSRSSWTNLSIALFFVYFIRH